jgi:hypothetical protein
MDLIDIQTIKYIFTGYLDTTLYRDAYFDLVKETQRKGFYDPAVGILDKWLWKYGYCTIGQFRNL